MKTMAGVALAAVVGACALAGGVQRAAALTVNVTGFVNQGGPDANASVNLFFFTNGTSFGSGYFSTEFQYNNDFIGYTVTSNRVEGSFTSVHSCGINCTEKSFSATFYDYVFDGFGANPGDPFPFPPTGASFKIGGSVQKFNTGIDTSFEYYDLNGVVGFEYPSNLSINAVPLPAAAPMFGAALLALGGLAFARRRGAVAQL